MGKHLGVPAYKLMGQKVRDAVPAAAWTRPCPPDVFREEVRRAVAEGYRVFKMHSSPPLRRDRADQGGRGGRPSRIPPPLGLQPHAHAGRRAPRSSRSCGTTPSSASSRIRCHGTIWTGGATCAAKPRIPLVMHVPPLAAAHRGVLEAADLYMIGARGIGHAMRQGYAYAAANKQVIIQQTGNTLMKAMTLAPGGGAADGHRSHRQRRRPVRGRHHDDPHSRRRRQLAGPGGARARRGGGTKRR